MKTRQNDTFTMLHLSPCHWYQPASHMNPCTDMRVFGWYYNNLI